VTRATVDPAATMAELEQKDPDLREALDAADAGRVTALVTWLQRQEEPERLRFAAAQLELLMPEDEVRPDDARLYRLRHRLRALVNVDLERPELDLLAANALAYALVAGTPSPVKAELEQARQLVPQLEKAMDADPKPSDAVLDTIGCVRYRLGDFQQARDRFAKAVEIASARPADPPRGSPYARETWQQINAESLRLYRARLEASERSLAAAGDGKPPEPLPLGPGVDAIPAEKAPTAAPEAPLP
jgi:hypothetical protein